MKIFYNCPRLDLMLDRCPSSLPLFNRIYLPSCLHPPAIPWTTLGLRICNRMSPEVPPHTCHQLFNVRVPNAVDPITAPLNLYLSSTYASIFRPLLTLLTQQKSKLLSQSHQTNFQLRFPCPSCHPFMSKFPTCFPTMSISSILSLHLFNTAEQESASVFGPAMV